MKKTAMLALAVMGLSLGGCATVIKGTHVDYKAQSDPEGANVKFTNGVECVTPCKVELRRKEDLRADITKDGFKPTYILIQSKLGGTSFGNILLGGGVGAVVDGANGASNVLSPNPLIVRLAPLASGDGAVLLDKKGNVIGTVKQHNDKVRVDVAKTIGAQLAGLEGGEGEQ